MCRLQALQVPQQSTPSDLTCGGVHDGVALCQDAGQGCPSVLRQLWERQNRNKYHECEEYGRYFQIKRDLGTDRSVEVSFISYYFSKHIYIVIYFALLRRSQFYLGPIAGCRDNLMFLGHPLSCNGSSLLAF